MSRIVATEYVSLDGVFEEPGNWSFPFWSDEAGKFKYEELFASDALLLGRLTYEGFAAAWPTMEGTGEFGERFNGMPKYVVSSTLTDPSWTNSRVLGANFVEEIAKLREQSGQDLLLCGSGQLLRELLRHNLVDEIRFMLHPIVLGQGKRLFPEGSDKTTLKLVDTKLLGNGVTVLTYEPDRTEAGA